MATPARQCIKIYAFIFESRVFFLGFGMASVAGVGLEILFTDGIGFSMSKMTAGAIELYHIVNTVCKFNSVRITKAFRVAGEAGFDLSLAACGVFPFAKIKHLRETLPAKGA